MSVHLTMPQTGIWPWTSDSSINLPCNPSLLNPSQVKIKYNFSKPFPCDCWYVQQNMIIHDIFTSRAPAAQRQMRKKNSFGPTFFHLAQTFGAYFFRRHFYFFLCYKRYELRKRLMTLNKQCRWRVFLNWWWPLVIIGYKVRPIIDTYLVDWTWCLFN